MTQKYEIINLKKLKLDSYNPRLPLNLHKKDEATVINWMLTDASLIELMLAIGNNGFFPGEPLLVVKEKSNYIVIEGNRRLASLRLLQDPSALFSLKVVLPNDPLSDLTNYLLRKSQS